MLNRPLKKRRKGQFFILGAFILVVLFASNLSFREPLANRPDTGTKYFSSNIQGELPRALNLGLNQSSADTVMLNFTRFINSEMASRGVNYSCLWLLAEGNAGNSDVNVTIANFLWGSRAVSLTLGATSRPLQVPFNSTNSTVFTSVPEKYNITIVYDGTSRTYEWQRAKANMYAYISLAKGDDSVMEHITG